MVFEAIDKGSIEELKVATARGDINFQKSDQEQDGTTPTALIYAVSQNSRLEIIELLCSVEGIDVNKRDKKGKLTPLSEAVKLKRAEVIKFLCFDNRTDVVHEDWDSEEKQEEMFELEVFYPLLVRLAVKGSQKFDIRKFNHRGDSLLHMAVSFGKSEDINFLCDKLFSIPRVLEFFESLIARNYNPENNPAQLEQFLEKCFPLEPEGERLELNNLSEVEIVENLLESADDKTSVLSELRSIAKDDYYTKDIKYTCIALEKVIVDRLKQNVNDKRLQYTFYKGSVYKNFVEGFIESTQEPELLLLGILYIGTQANIKCGSKNTDEESEEKSDRNKLKLFNNADVSNATNQSLVDTRDRNDQDDVKKGQISKNGKTDSYAAGESSVITASLKNTLGDEIYAKFKRKIAEMTNEEQKNGGQVSDVQLVTKSIYEAYFKEDDGFCRPVKERAAQLSERLSSMFMCCLRKILDHKCSYQGDWAFISCLWAIFLYGSDIFTDIRFGLVTLNGFSQRLGIFMIALVFATWIHENIRSVTSAYAADKELLRITLGKMKLTDADKDKYSELNYFNGHNSAIKWLGRFFWTYKVFNKKSKSFESTSIRAIFKNLVSMASKRALLFNLLSILWLRPIVDRVIVLLHPISHLRAIYRQESRQKILNQYYMILEQVPELVVQFYVFQITYNYLKTTKDYDKCPEKHRFEYEIQHFECIQNLSSLKICAVWLDVYSMLIPFFKIPGSMVGMEETFRKLRPETPKMSAAAAAFLYIAYILMVPSRLFLYAAVMHSAPDHFYVVAYLGLVTILRSAIYWCTWKAQSNHENGDRQNLEIRFNFQNVFSLLLFDFRDHFVISLRRPGAYLLSPSKVDYKTLRDWKRILTISSFFFVEGVVGAVFVEHYYPCGRNSWLFKHQGWLYLITLIMSVTIITLLSYILQPAKMYIIPRQFLNRAVIICLFGFVLFTVGALTFVLTTKNSATDVRLPLIITTLIILPVFLAVVVILKYFSEAKVKKSKNKDAATDETSKDKSCCLPKLSCFLCPCSSPDKDSDKNEASSSSGKDQGIDSRSEIKKCYTCSSTEDSDTGTDQVRDNETTHQLLKLPSFFRGRNAYRKVKSDEEASTGNVLSSCFCCSSNRNSTGDKTCETARENIGMSQLPTASSEDTDREDSKQEQAGTSNYKQEVSLDIQADPETAENNV